MPIFVNGERIEDHVIQAEAMRLQRMTRGGEAPEGGDPQTQAKDNLIARSLLQQKARERFPSISESEIDQGVQEMMDEQGGEKAFLQRHDLKDSDWPRVRQHVQESLRIQKLLDEVCEDLPEPEEDAILAYYKEHMDEFIVPPQVRVSHIVKRPSGPGDQAVYENMVAIRQELMQGGDFAEISRENTDCADDPTGDLGFFPRGKMVEAFDTIIFSMEVGEISPVFMTQFGLHIATVTDRKDARQQSLPEVREQIKRRLAAETENEKIDGYVESLKADAEIVEQAPEKKEGETESGDQGKSSSKKKPKKRRKK